MALPRRQKLCLIYTGGTIGMAMEQGVLKPPRDPSNFARIAPEILDLADIDFVPLMNKDSTNVTPADWTLMATAVYERLGRYQGFVITHGTDTMHFSASALAFAFGPNLNQPIVFTGSQTDGSVLHGDARINLIRAVLVALEPIAEVAIAFGDHVFRGCRTQKCDERRFNAFESPAFYPIADITERILIHPFARRVMPTRPPIEFVADFDADVLQVSLIPGLRPRMLVPLLDPASCDGVLLQAFGGGSVPNEGEYSFDPFIREAVGRGISVVIASQFPANSAFANHYETGLGALEAGAIPTGNMTHAAATAKFRWTIAKVKKEIRAGELRPEHKLARVSHLMGSVYIGEMDVRE